MYDLCIWRCWVCTPRLTCSSSFHRVGWNSFPHWVLGAHFSPCEKLSDWDPDGLCCVGTVRCVLKAECLVTDFWEDGNSHTAAFIEYFSWTCCFTYESGRMCPHS